MHIKVCFEPLCLSQSANALNLDQSKILSVKNLDLVKCIMINLSKFIKNIIYTHREMKEDI